MVEHLPSMPKAQVSAPCPSSCPNVLASQGQNLPEPASMRSLQESGLCRQNRMVHHGGWSQKCKVWT